MDEHELKNLIKDTNKMIYNVKNVLIQDNWEESKTEVYNIINNLRVIFSEVLELKTDRMLEIKDLMLKETDAILKSVDFEDTIQLADLLSCDMAELLGQLENIV